MGVCSDGPADALPPTTAATSRPMVQRRLRRRRASLMSASASHVSATAGSVLGWSSVTTPPRSWRRPRRAGTLWRAKATRSFTRAMTTPRSGVPATVMPRPRRNSSIPSFAQLAECSAARCWCSPRARWPDPWPAACAHRAGLHLRRWLDGSRQRPAGRGGVLGEVDLHGLHSAICSSSIIRKRQLGRRVRPALVGRRSPRRLFVSDFEWAI